MKYLFIALALMLPLFSFAQLTTGMIRYQETIHFKIEANEETSEFAHLFANSQTNDFLLRFTPEEAHYSFAETAAPPPIPQAEGEGTFQIKIIRSNDNSAVYTNFTERKRVEQRSIFGRPFRIEQLLDKGDWKLTNEQKDIMGYTCFKATSGPDTMQVTAWFTPQIAISAGPATYGQLPGMILEVEVNNIHLIATEITTELDDATLIEVPTKGKMVTEEEFDRLQQEKMDELNIRSGRRIEIRG